jgi:hypothetical protein
MTPRTAHELHSATVAHVTRLEAENAALKAENARLKEANFDLLLALEPVNAPPAVDTNLTF